MPQNSTQDDPDLTQLRDIIKPNNLLADEVTHITSGAIGKRANELASLALGSIVKDTYELVEVLGEGGMGKVFKALNLVWQDVEARDPYVALKILKPELSSNKQLVRSLFSDFDRTKMLSNCPNIIKVFGFDRDGSHVYMTMEYLKGKTLGEYLRGQGLDFVEAWPIIKGIGNALSFAHTHNIIHRDIKPGNVMMTNDGQVKVLDFGIASKINENEGDETLFSGHDMGALTVAYASPEMQRDYPPDPRDDVFAFACVVYEILTGNQFYKQKIRKAPPIKGLSRSQMDALNKGLAFNREDRIGSVNVFLDKLKPRKSNAIIYSAVAIALLCLIGMMLLFYLHSPLDTETPLTASKSPDILSPSPLPQADIVETPIVAKADQSNSMIVESTPAPAPTPILQDTLSESKSNDQAQVVSSSDQGLSSSSNSPDGIIHLQASKPVYKNGELFKLFFKLNEPGFIRIVDRDANGKLSVLYPNPKQPDRLLNKNKEYVFPPKGFNVPVSGMPGKSTVTMVLSKNPFTKGFSILKANGDLNEAIGSGDYSWTQIEYTLK